MKDLSEASGLPRQAIHFYIQQGLLPPGHKTGPNMAYYDEFHLERLMLIRKLQHERFLPLKVIKAVLDGRDEGFSEQQRNLLADVKVHLGATFGRDGGEREDVLADELLAQSGVDRTELDRLVELGVLGARTDADGKLRVAKDDGWVVELLGQMRDVGFSKELDFRPDDIAMYVEAIDALFEREVEVAFQRLSARPPEEVARMIEQAMPILHAFMTRYHLARVRDFFLAM